MQTTVDVTQPTKPAEPGSSQDRVDGQARSAFEQWWERQLYPHSFKDMGWAIWKACDEVWRQKEVAKFAAGGKDALDIGPIR
jgi:hypothetical protein